MILRTLELKHFGCFAERSFEFRQGMNLVVGPNESGKSTLMESIPAIFFGCRNKERYVPWNGSGGCEASLVLENSSRIITFRRNMISDKVGMIEQDDLYQTIYQFSGKVSPQGRSSEKGEYLEHLDRILSLSQEDIFRASLFFGQGSMNVSGQSDLITRIRSLLSGFAEINYDDVLGSLHKDYFTLTKVNPWGKDKTRDRELDRVRKEIQELEKRWYEGRSAMDKAALIRQQIDTVESVLAEDREEYAKGEAYISWVRQQWHLEQKEEVVKRDFNRVNRESGKVDELQNRREQILRDLEKTGLPETIPEKLPELLTQAGTIRQRMVEIKYEMAKLHEEMKKADISYWKTSAYAAVISIIIGGLLTYFQPDFSLYIIPLTLLAVVIAVGIGTMRNLRSRADVELVEKELHKAEQRRDVEQQSLDELNGHFEQLGMSPSPIEIVRMQSSLGKQQRLKASLREVESALAVLDDADMLEHDRLEYSRELAVLDERKEQSLVPPEGVMPLEDLPEAEMRLAEMKSSIGEQEKELFELVRQEAALLGELSGLQQIEEEGDSLRELEAKLKRRKNALAVGYEMLRDSVEEYRTSYLSDFNGDIGHFLSLATNGRYSHVQIDDKFSLSLVADGKDWKPLEYFSCGTIDAVYFSVRLALTRHLAQGVDLPLFLDDPLVNLDADRLKEALKLLERISKKHQVILFSHDEQMVRRAARERWHILSIKERKDSTITGKEEQDNGQLSLLQDY